MDSTRLSDSRGSVGLGFGFGVAVTVNVTTLLEVGCPILPVGGGVGGGGFGVPVTAVYALLVDS